MGSIGFWFTNQDAEGTLRKGRNHVKN